MRSFDRRQLLRAAPPFALSLVTFGSRRGLAAAPAQRFGEPQPFSFDLLRQRAKESTNRTYAATPPPAADLVQKIDFDAVQKIKFRADRGLWVDGSRPYPVRFFHLDKFNSLPVQINVISGGMARRLVYSQDDFEYGDPDVPQKLPADLGYSGFRLMDGPAAKTDWLAFQGASYFRSAGQDNQYGGSARGIAVNTTASSKEEFPRFTEFWLQEPDSKSAAVTIYAFLDGQSLTGAYELVASKHTGAIMDIRASLFIRNDIAQLGIAPLTSMYWYGENEKEHASDWRPEIHDSDGLALSTGKGERIWRPLIDPPSLQTNSFIDDNPKAFGLMQRDRDFADYQDDGAFYNKRPSMWVEPQGTWGPGMVQLVEIPTQDEIHDNIVAYWKPKRDIKAGNQLDFAYRLYWQNDEPHPPDDIARITATRIGKGGIPGRPMQDKDSWKFAIDFVGGPLARMAPRYDVTPVVSVSRGKILNPYVIKIVGTDRWRALFDIQAPGQEPVNLRCYLRLEDKALSETWLYQYFPPREPSRR